MSMADEVKRRDRFPAHNCSIFRRSRDGKGGQQMLQRLTNRSQIGRVDLESELQPIVASSFVNGLTVNMNPSLSVTGQEERDLALHRRKARRAVERLNKCLHLFEKCVELVSSEVGAKCPAKSTRYNFQFAINPVAVQVIEQARMFPGQRSYQHVLGL